MNDISSLKAAVRVLELGEVFSFEELQSNYRRLLKTYHPDSCVEPLSLCEEKTRAVIQAYRFLYSRIVKMRITLQSLDASTPQEFWLKRFASDGVWGNPGEDRKNS